MAVKRTILNIIYSGLITLFAFSAFCCHDEESERSTAERISSIDFNVKKVEVNVNEDFIVRVTARSEEGKKNEFIVYSSANAGIVEIREPSNDGFIVRGLKAGSTVIKAKSQNVDTLLEVKVYAEDVLAKYIKLDSPVIEIQEGQTVQTNVSLYARIPEPDDNSLFEWKLETGKKNIAVNTTGNIAVIRGLERGHQYIEIKHPRASIDNKILVFVTGVDEEVKYIYRDSNILVIPNNGQYHDFDVVLVNGVPSDAVNFKYAVVQGEECIEEISAAQTKCNVLPKKSGMATVRVSHELAEVDFDVRVIIFDVETPFITLDSTFLLLNINESANISAEVENSPNGVLHKNQFSCVIKENDVVVPNENSILEVIRTNENFYIRAKRAGTARIVVSNAQASTDREILVVVRDEAAYQDDYYITTEQNVITTQIGDNTTRLYARLVNGNTGHANSFVWEVDDLTVVKLYTNHGNVRPASRNMVSGPKSVFEAFCDIEPLKVGTTRITITNASFPETMAQVIVRVYPKGTFVASPIRVGYDGLIRIEYGKPETINLIMLEGLETGAGRLEWELEDTSVAKFWLNVISNNMTNVLEAVQNSGGGMTKLRVSGVNLQFPHESLVAAGSENYLKSLSVIYVNNIYQKVLEQQTLDVHILNSKLKENGEVDENWEAAGFTAEVIDKTKAYAVMARNVLKIMGKERGETDIIVSNSQAANKSITIHVRVEPANISIEQPYYITGPEIKGVVRNLNTEIQAAMPGAPETEVQKLGWSSKDANIVTAAGTGSSALLNGKASGKQTFVTVAHKNNKAAAKDILIYVVETAAELEHVVMGVKQQNYLLKKGQEQLVNIITNATDKQKKNIEWKVLTKNGEPSPVAIDAHYDSVLIKAAAAGNCTIEAEYTDYDDNGQLTGKVTLPLSIYVSVVETLSDEKIIKGPAVIEIVRGESRIVAVEQLNLSQAEMMNIKWAVEMNMGEEPIANIEGNGDSAYIYGLRKGVGRVKIWQDSLKYSHYATLVCANSWEELENLYVMGVDASYQKMMLGEEKRVRLSFGSNGFPEAARKNLKWTEDGTGKVRIAGSPGESVSIVAREPGEATVTVTDINNPKVSFNGTLEMKFLVIDPNKSNLEFRGHQKMVGIVVGQSAEVKFNLFDNDEEIKNYHLWSHETENKNVVSVNRVDADPSGQKLVIQALKEGEEYITVRYNNEVSARILVYTALTADALESYYPILVEKTNYLVQVGESAVIKIETMTEKDSANFNKVSWGIEGANFIENIDTAGKKEFTIKGKSPGQTVFSVNYTDKGKTETKARIFVTVVSNEEIDATKYMVTEGIIGINEGSSVNTKILHNLGAGVSSVVWASEMPSVVSVSGSGENATLTAVSAGEAYVTVSYGSWLKRYIRVYVRTTGANLGDYRAMNIENQYYRIGVGESFTLPVYFAPLKTAAATLWTDKYDNKVVRFETMENGAKAEITSISEGVAVLEARNTGLNDNTHILRIYVESSKRYNGAAKPVTPKFLTISKTLYVMNPDEKDKELNLEVSGYGYMPEEMETVTWQLTDAASGTLISIYPNGRECRVRVNPAGKEGTAEIRASKTENEVLIRIIVTKTGLVGYPHIVGEDTVRVGVNQKISVVYEAVETGTYDMNQFVAQVMGTGSSYVTAKFNKNVLEIEGKASGQAVLRITCAPTVDAAHYKDVAVLVTTTMDGLIYLTTRDNFSQVKIGEAKTVSVDMVGLNNPQESGYTWTIANEDKTYLRVSPTGRQCQMEGLEAGSGKTVKVTVKNTLAPDIYELIMYVRISDNYFNTKYLTTQNNVVSLIKGKSTYLTAELVNGAPGEESMISWQSLDPDYAQVMGTGTQAYVVAKNLGFARIQAQYQTAVNKVIEILVIIEADTSSDGIYIASNDGLVIMKPGDTRQLSVRLVGGGGAGDEYGFSWAEYIQNPPLNAAKTNKVAEIIANDGAAIIVRALREGEQTIRVTHAKSSYQLDLKIYVQEYNNVEFESENLTVQVGEQKIVRVSIPPQTQVQYTVNRTGIVQLSPDTNTPTSSVYLVVEGKAVGIVTITASCLQKPLTDEMIVQVVPNPNQPLGYITTNDTLFNVVDLKNAENRLMVSGVVTGEKPNGQVFKENDSLGLVWTIANSASSPATMYPDGGEYIAFDKQENGQKTTGNLVSIEPKKPGMAEIRLTHPEMQTGYYKSVFVNVTQYDGSYYLNPIFSSNQVGETVTYTVKIANDFEGLDADLREYSKLTWRIIPDKDRNGNDKYGIRFINKEPGDTDYVKKGKNRLNKVTLEAFDTGVFKLKTEYEGREIEAIVYVEKKRELEVSSESFIKIAPRMTVFVGLWHQPLSPVGTQFRIENEYHQFAEVGYVGPIKDENDEIHREWLRIPDEKLSDYRKLTYKELYETVDYKNKGMTYRGQQYYTGDWEERYWYSMEDDFNESIIKYLNDQAEEREAFYNGVLVIRGTEYEGLTKIRIKHNNIERMVTVHNSLDHNFNMTGIVDPETGDLKKASMVRGKPGETVTIAYEVTPKGSEIKDGHTELQMDGTVKSYNGWPYYEGFAGTIDKSAQKILSYSKNEARQEITIKLEKCGFTELYFTSEILQKIMKIPVYIYYDVIDVNWLMENKPDERTPKSRMDGQKNAIYIRENNAVFVKIEMNDSNVKGYPGDNLEIAEIIFSPGVPNQVTNSNRKIYNNINNNYVTFNGNVFDPVMNDNNSLGVKNGDTEYMRFGAIKRMNNIMGVIIQGKAVGSNGSILKEVNYMGLLEIKYKYSNGGQSMASYTKNFMIYHEKY